MPLLVPGKHLADDLRMPTVRRLLGAVLAVTLLLTACTTVAPEPTPVAGIAGRWVDPAGTGTFIEFADEGSAAVAANGCIDGRVGWDELGDGTYSLELEFVALVLCEDTWLSGNSAVATLDGDSMTITDPDGTTLGTLERDSG
jgi:outer membrane biogenesis lipoprotein LolB